MRLPFKAVAIATILSSCGAVIVSAQKDADPILAKASTYRRWTRANKAPLGVITLAPARDSAADFAGG
ncbi:MAG: hypothetical protein QOE77_58 [Blastocatellia bacterium]|jgi:hypothetical protein|nr:hypothetical protein [Blastocatellia bacterium]